MSTRALQIIVKLDEDGEQDDDQVVDVAMETLRCLSELLKVGIDGASEPPIFDGSMCASVVKVDDDWNIVPKKTKKSKP